MWAMGGYLQSETIVGVIRFSLQQPTVDNCDPSKAQCFNAFSPLNTLPYCEQYERKISNASYKGKSYPCEIYEATNAQIVSEKSITVVTRGTITNQTLVCGVDDQTCGRTYNDTSLEHKFYTAQSEAFTVLFDHAVTASKICSRHTPESYACSAQASQYQGRLYSVNDELCAQEHKQANSFAHYRGKIETEQAPCYVQPNRTSQDQDFFSLEVLLMAAGMNLDDCNGKSEEMPCQTYRDSGATVLLNIYWADFSPYEGMVEPYYYYKTQLIAGSSFKQYIPFYNNYRQSRTLLNAHGIKLAVLLGGEFNQFNAVAFLVTLTTALGLLAVATTIVDNLMLYVLPEKRRYQEAKYESTEQFHTEGVLTSALEGFDHLVRNTNDNDEEDQEGGRDAAPMNEGMEEPLLQSDD